MGELKFESFVTVSEHERPSEYQTTVVLVGFEMIKNHERAHGRVYERKSKLRRRSSMSCNHEYTVLIKFCSVRCKR